MSYWIFRNFLRDLLELSHSELKPIIDKTYNSRTMKLVVNASMTEKLPRCDEAT